MEISVMMGNSQMNLVVKGVDEKVNIFGFNSIVGRNNNRVCFGEFKYLRDNSYSGVGLTLKAVNAHTSHAMDKVCVDTSFANPNSFDGKKAKKLYVGLPMDIVSECGKVNHEKAITTGLKALKLMGIHGVELPIWWGVVEKHGMGKYDWSGYLAIADLVQKMGLKLHVSLCFHASQQQKISLPDWVSQIGEAEPGIFFTDRFGRQYNDCLSFAVDEVPVLNGKSPVEVYQEFSESFKSVFSPVMGSTITGISVGLGPDGELRYPSHHYEAKPNNQTGVGEFQCYDKYMLSHLKEHADVAGCPLWGLGGPHDVPAYDEPPSVNNFFKNEGGSWETPYGDFFLSWYSTQLLTHGDRILSLASAVFSDTPVTISGKLPLMHSWYQTRSHPSELTAGFYNTANRDGYEAIVEMFANHSCNILLPGMNLPDVHQSNGSSPRSLLAQIKGSCRRHSVRVFGQNVSLSGSSEFEEIRKNLSEDDDVVDTFMYQRMGAEFFSPKHFPLFSAFVRTLKQSDLDVDDMPDTEPMESVRASSEAGGHLQVQMA